MKTITSILLLLLLCAAMALSACASQSSHTTASGKKLKLETIDRGPMRPKTYVYREVDDPGR